jgi:hypothetical protein
MLPVRFIIQKWYAGLLGNQVGESATTGAFYELRL